MHPEYALQHCEIDGYWYIGENECEGLIQLDSQFLSNENATINGTFYSKAESMIELTCKCRRGIPLSRLDGFEILETQVLDVTCIHREQIYIHGNPSCIQYTSDLSNVNCREGLVCYNNQTLLALIGELTDVAINGKNSKYVTLLLL